MTPKELSAAFDKEYQHLFEKGLVNHGVSRLTNDVLSEERVLVAGLDFLNVTTPFVFDRRAIPRTFKGFEVSVAIVSDDSKVEMTSDAFFPKEFDVPENDDRIPYDVYWHSSKYEAFVDRCADEIRTILDEPTMTREEMLDALTFGSFEELKRENEELRKERLSRYDAISFILVWDELHRSIAEEDGTLKEELLPIWNNNTSWTNYIIGQAQVQNKDSRLGDLLLSHFTDLRYRKEEWKIDLVLAKTPNFQGVLSMHAKPLEIQLKPSEVFYPTDYKILVEHENNIELCYEEMIKLTQVKARLKVLITYNYENTSATSSDDLIMPLERAATNFASIIEQANRQHPENEHTEYLLIIGSSIEENKNLFLDWQYYVFNSCGKLIYQRKAYLH